jgi:hypothetical protein
MKATAQFKLPELSPHEWREAGRKVACEVTRWTPYVKATGKVSRGSEHYSVKLPNGHFTCDLPMGASLVEVRTVMTNYSQIMVNTRKVTAFEARKRFARACFGSLHESGTLSTAEFYDALTKLDAASAN